MGEDTQTPLLFADFTLDLARGRLLGRNGDVALRPKTFALLSHIVRHAGRVVSKKELLPAIWPEVTLIEDSFTRCVHEVGAPSATLAGAPAHRAATVLSVRRPTGRQCQVAVPARGDAEGTAIRSP